MATATTVVVVTAPAPTTPPTATATVTVLSPRPIKRVYGGSSFDRATKQRVWDGTQFGAG